MAGRRRTAAARLAVGCVLTAGVLAVGAPAQGQVVFDCKDVFAYFARGTGQETGTSREAGAFFSEIERRIDRSKLTYQPAQAGDGAGYKGNRYRAAGSVTDLAEAWSEVHNFGAEDLGVYYQSVNEGVAEVLPYLNDRAAACPDEQWILGGYSQGAHVIGNVLRHSALSAAAHDNIAFATFFGDPKLLLNGRGTALTAPACRGLQYQWVRGNVACWSDGGVLVPPNPYVPAGLVDRVGSWCDHLDGICAGNELRAAIGRVITAHGEYPDQEIPEAAREAVAHLRARMPAAPEGSLDITRLPISTGTTGIDVAIVMDTTGSMGGAIDSARAHARSIGDAIVGLPGGRVALVQYKDHPDQGDPFASRLEVPFTDDVNALQAGLDGLSADGGGDGPEAVFSGLMTAFNDLSWKNGATKVAIIIADTGGKDPEPVTGFTSAQVLARARELDPVAIYPLLTYPGPDPFYDALAEGSAGKVIPFTDGDAGAALLNALDLIKFQPIGVLDGPYLAEPGDEVTFDAGESYDPNGEIVEYAWDFEGDGIIDETTATPNAHHRYMEAFTGQIVVTVTSSDGGRAQGSSPVTVAPAPLTDLVPPAPGAIVATATGTGTAHIQWQPPANDVDVSGYLVTPSVALATGSRGIVAVEGTEATVTELPGGATVTFTVQAVTDAGRGELGTSSPIVVPGDPAPTTTALGTCIGAAAPDCEPPQPTHSDALAAGASSAADGNASQSGGRTGLPITGATILPLAVAGCALVAAGASALRARGRRRHIGNTDRERQWKP